MESCALKSLLQEIQGCRVCEKHLPFLPKPVLRASESASLLIVGQAPGQRVHQTGIPWNDPSGDRLRKWLNLSRDEFYDEKRIAIIPTGLCYPGKGDHGDLPPRPECAPLWHPPLLELLPKIQLILLVGSYAQTFYLKERARPTLAETVRAYRNYLPLLLPLPHPSPRNQRWFQKHPWFEKEVIPFLRKSIRGVLQ